MEWDDISDKAKAFGDSPVMDTLKVGGAAIVQNTVQRIEVAEVIQVDHHGTAKVTVQALPGEALLTFSIDRTEVTAAARVVVQSPGGHSHSYTDAVTAPTCTEQGYTTHTCACGESYVDSWVDALGHSWSEWEVVQEPADGSPGLRQRTCGETEREEISELEVNYGDANGDGRTNSLDVIILRQYLADWDVTLGPKS